MRICLCRALQATPEPSASESGVSDDDGVVISKEDLEESINQAVVRPILPSLVTDTNLPFNAHINMR